MSWVLKAVVGVVVMTKAVEVQMKIKMTCVGGDKMTMLLVMREVTKVMMEEVEII